MKLIPFLMTSIIIFHSCDVLADIQQNDLWTSHEEQGMDTMTPRKGTGFASTSFSFEKPLVCISSTSGEISRNV